MAKRPTRIDLLELDIDLRLADLWREAGEVSEWNLEVVAAFMRAAYGKGYCDALTEDDPGSLCHEHGYRIPARRETAPRTRLDASGYDSLIVARRRNPARLVIALSVAAVLAVFLLYTSIAGGGTPSFSPSELAGKTGASPSRGRVVGPVTGDAHDGGLRFRLRDVKGPAADGRPGRVQGSVPDLFRPGRDVARRRASLSNGTFVAVPGTLVTKCPSKYTPPRTA